MSPPYISNFWAEDITASKTLYEIKILTLDGSGSVSEGTGQDSLIPRKAKKCILYLSLVFHIYEPPDI